MLPDGPIPKFDPKHFWVLHEPCPSEVLDLLVEGVERFGEGAYGGGFTALRDDDEDERSVFSFGPPHDRRTLEGRTAKAAWLLAIERGVVPPSWRDDPLRCFPDQSLRFLCNACNGFGATGWNYDELCAGCHGRGHETVRLHLALPTEPWTVAWMLAHPQVIERCECLAREAATRVGGSARRVQWGRTRTRRPHGPLRLVLQSPIFDLAQPRPSGWDWDAMRGPAFSAAPWWPVVSGLPTSTRDLLCFDVGLAWHHEAERIVASPMEPILRLWERGVMIEELTSDAIVLARATDRDLRSWRSGAPG